VKQASDLGWKVLVPALVAGVWLFVRPSEEAWYWRLFGAVFLGVFLQGGALVAIALCEHFLLNIGERPQPVETVADNMFSPTTIGGALVAIAVFVMMQHSRLERERDIERCLKPATRGTLPVDAYRQCIEDLAPVDDSDE
jgi:hypothetical protein